MENKSRQTQVAVVGGGPGGYPAAFMAADLGKEVTLIDTETNPGGVCLHRGCIPTKTLLHLAKLIRESEESGRWGVTFQKPVLDIQRIRSWKNEVIAKLTGGLGQLSRQRNISYTVGKAVFRDARSLQILGKDGSTDVLTFEHAILATGTEPVSLPFGPKGSPLIIDSDKALDLDDIPETLLVIGGGYIGLEMGTIYSAFGSKVTVVEMMPTLLPGADPDLLRPYMMRNSRTFEAVHTQTVLENMEECPEGIRVRLKKADNTTSETTFKKVLVTVGRKPRSRDLGLNTTSVKTDSRGFVLVDGQFRTGEPSIFAVGDLIGGALLAHKATREGRTAAEILTGHDPVKKARTIPSVLYTDPEIAWCGLTESEARSKSLPFRTSKFLWAASGRALSMGRSDGMTKWIVDPQTDRVLGAGVVGPGAGELIAECVLAVEMEAKISDVARAIHPHPTLSETVMEAAEVYLNRCTHTIQAKGTVQER